jgi:hypothetical protein
MADEHHDPEGNSVAAWVAVSVITVGFLVGAVAVWIATPWLAYVGIGVCVLGLVLGKVLAMMGFGVPREGQHAAHAETATPAD